MARVRRKRRRRRLQPALVVLSAVLLAVMSYGLVWPILTFSLQSAAPGGDRFEGTLHELIRLRSLQALAVVWIFFFGACIGSFLNVVIYRVPRGRTLLGSSYCPYCGHAIRIQHNIPVIGWLLLRGRCRDCRLPISPRYPLVETLVGSVFLVLALVELFSGGRNLPIRPANFYAGVEWIVFAPQWDLIRIYGFHSGLLAVLLSWALVWHDRQNVPAGYGLLALAAAFLLPLASRDLLIVPWNAWQQSRWPMSQWNALASGIFGAAGGGFVAIVSWWTHRIHHGARLKHGLRGALSHSLIGAVVGWQALLSIALLVPLLRGAGHLLFRRITSDVTASWSLALLAATWLQICIWKQLASAGGWPTHDTKLVVAPLYVLAAALVSAVVSRFLDAGPPPPPLVQKEVESQQEEGNERQYDA